MNCNNYTKWIKAEIKTHEELTETHVSSMKKKKNT